MFLLKMLTFWTIRLLNVSSWLFTKNVDNTEPLMPFSTKNVNILGKNVDILGEKPLENDILTTYNISCK